MKLKDNIVIIMGAGVGISEAISILFVEEVSKDSCNFFSDSVNHD